MSTFESDLDDVRRFIDELGAERVEIQQQTAAARDARRAEDEEAAAQRRSGAMGREWQVLQERIDMRMTTVEDIVNGVDLSDEARSVRSLAATNLASVREAYIADVRDQDAPLGQAVEELSAAQARLSRTLADLADRLDGR